MIGVLPLEPYLRVFFETEEFGKLVLKHMITFREKILI